MSTSLTTSPAKKLMTADEFWTFINRPENRDRDFELIRGQPVEAPHPSQSQGAIALAVALELGLYARRVSRGCVVTETGLLLEEEPATVVNPDVAYYTEADRLEELHPRWAEVPPLLVVEVSSPNDRLGRINARTQDYLTHGVKVVWQVNSGERNVTVYRPNRVAEVVPQSGELTGGDDLPGLQIRVIDLFRLPGDHPDTLL